MTQCPSTPRTVLAVHDRHHTPVCLKAPRANLLSQSEAIAYQTVDSVTGHHSLSLFWLLSIFFTYEASPFSLPSHSRVPSLPWSRLYPRPHAWVNSLAQNMDVQMVSVYK